MVQRILRVKLGGERILRVSDSNSMDVEQFLAELGYAESRFFRKKTILKFWLARITGGPSGRSFYRKSALVDAAFYGLISPFFVHAECIRLVTRKKIVDL